MQFINIWNAACDGGDQRKTNRQLVQELMEWERTVGSGGAAAVSSSLLKRQRTANDSKADNGQHLTKYRDQFAELIATVKRQRCQTKENRNIT
jgi:hypothetical protein